MSRFEALLHSEDEEVKALREDKIENNHFQKSISKKLFEQLKVNRNMKKNQDNLKEKLKDLKDDYDSQSNHISSLQNRISTGTIQLKEAYEQINAEKQSYEKCKNELDIANKRIGAEMKKKDLSQQIISTSQSMTTLALMPPSSFSKKRKTGAIIVKDNLSLLANVAADDTPLITAN